MPAVDLLHGRIGVVATAPRHPWHCTELPALFYEPRVRSPKLQCIYGHGPVPYTQLTRPLSAGGNNQQVCYSNFVRWRCCLNYGFCFYLGMKVGGLAPDLTERGPGKIFPHRPGWGRNNDFPTILIDLKAALVF